ncbi:unnamed protein product, partial [Mycena citricolor]
RAGAQGSTPLSISLTAQSRCLLNSSVMANKETPSVSLAGGCTCGLVQFNLSSKPLFSVFCHCTRCQRADGAIFVASAHFPDEAFAFTASSAPHNELETVGDMKLYRCKQCRSCAAAKLDTGNWALRPTQFARGADDMVLNWDILKPTAHIFYNTRVVDVQDGLPKWAGFPRSSDRMNETKEAA